MSESMPCPVKYCRAEGDKPCRGSLGTPLSQQHPERTSPDNTEVKRLHAELANRDKLLEKYRETVSVIVGQREEALSESDLGAQILAQWEALADADRDRLAAERDRYRLAWQSAQVSPMTDTYQVAEGSGWMDAQGVHHRPIHGAFSLRDLTDDGLTRLEKQRRRAVEDGMPVPDAAIREVRAVRIMRLLLRMRYGAVDNHVGTHSYDHWYRLDKAPSYDLALLMDHGRWCLGRRHVLSWNSAMAARKHERT